MAGSTSIEVIGAAQAARMEESLALLSARSPTRCGGPC